MDKTVYLHIGWGRCGSSSIQHFALNNRAALRTRGVYYPVAEEMALPPTRGGNGQVLKPPTGWRTRIDHVAAAIAKVPDKTLLMSSEFLSPLPPQYFQTMRRSFTDRGIALVVVAYVREQREWLISRYAQAVKSRRWTMSLEEYLRERYHSSYLNYAERFEALAQVLGRENLSVHLFQRDGLTDGDVRIDLFDLMKLNVRDIISDDPDANASASVEEVETMRVVNALPGSGINNREFLRRSQVYFRQRRWQANRELYRLAPPALMNEIKQYYAEPNERFRREFFPERKAPLFHSRIPDSYAVLHPGERINERSLELLLNYFADRNSPPTAPADPRSESIATGRRAARTSRFQWLGL
jgi:hypothetical protein